MQVFSKAKVTIDGEVILARESASFDPGGVERTVQKSMNRIDGYSEAPKEATLEFDFSVTKGVSLTDLNAMTNVTIQVELDTGQFYVMRNAWNANPATLTTGNNGAGKVTFNSAPAEEIL